MKDRKRLPKVIAMNDMSCHGACSLTVALPVMSARGVEVLPLPTAILSTHTGGGWQPTCLDLTQEMRGIIKNWCEISLEVEGIYTGYFSSVEQIAVAEELCDTLRREGDLLVVDPVMADNGSWYTGFDETHAQAMLRLVRKADVITPNYTEAQFLLGQPVQRIMTEVELGEVLEALLEIGSSHVVITVVLRSVLSP